MSRSRDRNDNAGLTGLDLVALGRARAQILAPVNVPGPTALLPDVRSAADLELAKGLVAAYSRYDRLEGDIRLNVGIVPRPYDRSPYKAWQIC